MFINLSTRKTALPVSTHRADFPDEQRGPTVCLCILWCALCPPACGQRLVANRPGFHLHTVPMHGYLLTVRLIHAWHAAIDQPVQSSEQRYHPTPFRLTRIFRTVTGMQSFSLCERYKTNPFRLTRIFRTVTGIQSLSLCERYKTNPFRLTRIFKTVTGMQSFSLCERYKTNPFRLIRIFKTVTGMQSFSLCERYKTNPLSFNSYFNNNNLHLSCAHQHPEQSHDTY